MLWILGLLICAILFFIYLPRPANRAVSCLVLDGEFVGRAGNLPIPLFNFTNTFHIVVAKERYLLQVRDDRGRVFIQACCDGVDMGYWRHHYEIPNYEATANIYAGPFGTNHGAGFAGFPLDYPENHLVFPLLWSVPRISQDIGPFFRKNYIDTGLIPDALNDPHPAGIFTTNLFDASNVLIERKIFTYPSTNAETRRWPLMMYDVAFTNYSAVTGCNVPFDFAVMDKRGGMAASMTNSTHITNAQLVMIKPSEMYPDIKMIRTIVVDRRLHLTYNVQDGAWPSRSSPFYIQTARRLKYQRWQQAFHKFTAIFKGDSQNKK